MTHTSHQPACPRAELVALLTSWHQAQFFSPVLLHRTSSTIPSAPQEEIVPGTQVRSAQNMEGRF